MIRYSIADLENLTGIKAHTIRIWEKRYDLIRPHRTETNIRYYDNDQMRKLINVSTLLRGGMKISRISKLSDKEINERIADEIDGSSKDKDTLFEAYTGQLINAGLRFNETLFDQVLTNAVRRFGIQECYENLFIPLLQRVGIFWSVNDMNPAQEHFITSLLKQKLYAAIDSLPPATENDKSILLFLPQNESHEIGLIMAKYILRNAGKQVIYLGARVPFVNLESTVEQCRPTHLLFLLIQIHPFEQIQQYIDLLSATFNKKRIFVSGLPYILENLKIPDNITWIKSPREIGNIMN